MRPSPVIEDFDVLETRRAQVGMGSIAPPVPLVLETVEPVVGRSIVPTVARPAHQARHAVFPERALKGRARVRAAPVGVVQQLRHRTPPEPGYDQCIGDNIRRHARLHDLPTISRLNSSISIAE